MFAAHACGDAVETGAEEEGEEGNESLSVRVLELEVLQLGVARA